MASWPWLAKLEAFINFIYFYFNETEGQHSRLQRKEKITPISKYRHEDEPVGLGLITVFRDAT